MSLEQALRRLSLRPSKLCQQCRRSFATSPTRRQQQSATVAFADLMQASRSEAPTQRPRARDPTAPLPTIPTSNPTASSPGPRTSLDIARDAVRESAAVHRQREESQRLADMQRTYNRKDLEGQVTRRWKPGDVYAPHDLSGAEASKWKKVRRRGKQRVDVVDQLGINPIDHYKNFSMMSEYITDMGRIKHSRETSLRPVNQRRMAKAIRRAVGIGLMPGVHKHPEILKIETAQRRPRY